MMEKNISLQSTRIILRDCTICRNQAQTPANRLPIEAGDRVLDVCAAPGGKATELGAKLNGSEFCRERPE